uniref:Uncharacterized protein n=1 Tax=Bacteriophage sp. TaxID=38018 RepID=A0A8D9PEF7_9VIRU|nr:MAG TPA: hypothetical protein [Bacteriophage sp.]
MIASKLIICRQWTSLQINSYYWLRFLFITT